MKPNNADVGLEVKSDDQTAAAYRIHIVPGQLFGTEMQININLHEKLVRDGARKFRSTGLEYHPNKALLFYNWRWPIHEPQRDTVRICRAAIRGAFDIVVTIIRLHRQ